MARQATTRLKTPAARKNLVARVEPYYEQISPGHTLGYIKRESGPGTWVHRWKEGGRYVRKALGAADDGVQADGEKVLAHAQALRKATNAGARAPGARLTVDDALDAYFDVLAAESKHVGQYRAAAARHISPVLGKHRVENLTKTEIEGWLAGLVVDEDEDDPDARRRSQDTANRILTILKAALNAAFADEANHITTDAAWRRVKPFKKVARARQVNLETAQVRTLIAKANTLDPAFAALLEAAYLTGARMGELAGATVRALDIGKHQLRVDGKTGPRIVTLTTEATAFLKKRAEKKLPTAYLLPDSAGGKWPRSGHHRVMKRAAELANLPDDTCVYSLRHAHASRAIEAGMPLSVLAENLGTSLLMLQRNYAHVLQRTRRDVIQATAPKLRRVK